MDDDYRQMHATKHIVVAADAVMKITLLRYVTRGDDWSITKSEWPKTPTSCLELPVTRRCDQEAYNTKRHRPKRRCRVVAIRSLTRTLMYFGPCNWSMDILDSAFHWNLIQSTGLEWHRVYFVIQF